MIFYRSLLLSAIELNDIYTYVIVKSHYKEVIIVIIRVRSGAEDKCNNSDNLQVQWDLTGFYPIVFDVCHITQ